MKPFFAVTFGDSPDDLVSSWRIESEQSDDNFMEISPYSSIADQASKAADLCDMDAQERTAVMNIVFEYRDMPAMETAPSHESYLNHHSAVSDHLGEMFFDEKLMINYFCFIEENTAKLCLFDTDESINKKARALLDAGFSEVRFFPRLN